MDSRVIPASAGGWFAVVTESRMLVLPANEGGVSELWDAIRTPDGFQTVLDLLTIRGLAATPPFVLVERLPGVDARLIVRGDVSVEISDADGVQVVSAGSVSTWTERTVPGARAFALDVPGASRATESELPLGSGVALVASVRVGESAAEPQIAGAPAMSVAASTLAVPSPVTVPAPTAVDVEATIAGILDPDAAPTPASVERDPAVEAFTDGYDYLFGDTQFRSTADAAVREKATADDSSAAGDHDGHTVLVADVARIRASRRTSSAAAEESMPTTPGLALVISTTGAREPLTQPVLVGRSPSVSKLSGGQIPRLLTIGGIDQDISRNHAQVSVEGGTAVVTDLHSKNGTSIMMPGKAAQRLRAGEPTAVIVGTVIDLGGGITLTVEENS